MSQSYVEWKLFRASATAGLSNFQPANPSRGVPSPKNASAELRRLSNFGGLICLFRGDWVQSPGIGEGFRRPTRPVLSRARLRRLKIALAILRSVDRLTFW
jgi:hypothetical protein